MDSKYENLPPKFQHARKLGTFIAISSA